MNVIVTGATGFIGSYLVSELLGNDYSVYAVVRDEEKIQNWAVNKNLHIILNPLENLEVQNFPTISYDAFLHLAWNGVNRKDIDNEEIHKTNFNNAKKCLKLCKQLGCKRFLDAGSRAEYGNIEGIYKESCESNPIDAYSREKLHFYKYALDYCRAQNIRYVHFRIFSVIGKGDHPWSLISTACSSLVTNREMKMGSCEQFWNFMDIRDVSSAIRRVVECMDSLCQDDHGIINIANYDTRILRSFIEEIRIITKSTSVLRFDENKKGISIIPDITRLVALTNWQAQYSFSDSIKSILEII